MSFWSVLAQIGAANGAYRTAYVCIYIYIYMVPPPPPWTLYIYIYIYILHIFLSRVNDASSQTTLTPELVFGKTDG